MFVAAEVLGGQDGEVDEPHERRNRGSGVDCNDGVDQVTASFVDGALVLTSTQAVDASHCDTGP